MMVINSKLVRFHANDLIDHRVIQSGKFIPSLSISSVEAAMQEIIDMMSWTLDRSNLKIEFIKDSSVTHYLNFDKRRL